jgi:DNA-binding NarL/FixJ family response regulator
MSYTRSELVPLFAPLMLSPRLIDVRALLLQGRSNKLIARDLSLSPETVKEYVATILHRLGLTSRAQVAMSVRTLHEPLLAWDIARREGASPYRARELSTSHHAF